MFSRSHKKGTGRHGSASSLDLASQAATPPSQEAALPTIPGSPSQPSKEPSQASAAPSSSGGGRAFNFLVERARGAVGSRPRTASDEGRSPLAASDKTSPALPTSASTSAIGQQPPAGRFFGRANSSSNASEPSPSSSAQEPEASSAAEAPGTSLPRSTGGFFSRKSTSSNAPKPGWLAKGGGDKQQQAPAPLAPSPSSPALSQKAPLSPSEPEFKSKREKEPGSGRKQSLTGSESGGVSRDSSLRTESATQLLTQPPPSQLLASSRKAFSRSVEDLTGRRSSKHSPRLGPDDSGAEPPPPVPAISASHSGEFKSGSDSEAAQAERKAATRRNRTTSLFPGSTLNPARSPTVGSGSGSQPASPTVPFPTSASVPNFSVGQYNSQQQRSPDLNGEGSKRDSQVIILQGFLQRKRDYHAPQSPTASTGSKSPNSFHHSPLFGGTSSPSEAKMSSSVGSSSYFPSLRLRTPGSGKGEPDLSRNWRPYAAVLRGTKLYLYKVPSDLEKAAKSMFPTGIVFPPNSPTTERPSKSSSSPSQSTLQLLKDWVPINKPNLVLSLSGVEVHAYDNSQRSFVFELATEDGQRSLLQASSKEQLDLWVDNFHRSGTQIANRRATLLAQTPLTEESEDAVLASMADDSRQIAALAPTYSVSSGSKALFGVPLWEIVQREKAALPRFVEAALSAVEGRGLGEVGIYRISGESRIISELKLSLDKGADPLALFKDMDVHNITGIFKLWLREMPELIPFSLYHDFIQADAIDGYDERLYAIRDLTWRMPQPHFDLIKRLMAHLELITDNESVNAMHAQNLAIIFAPTLLKSGQGSFGFDMLNLGKAAKIVSSLILQSAWVFGEGAEEEEAAEDAAAAAEQAEIEEEVAAEQAASASQPLGVGLGLEPGAPAAEVEKAVEEAAPAVADEPAAEVVKLERDAELEDDTVVPGKELPAVEAAAEAEEPIAQSAAADQAEASEPTAAPTAHTSPISPGASSPGSEAFFEATTSPVLSESAGSPDAGVSSLTAQVEGLTAGENRLSLGGPMTPIDEGVFSSFAAPTTPEITASKATAKEGGQ